MWLLFPCHSCLPVTCQPLWQCWAKLTVVSRTVSDPGKLKAPVTHNVPITRVQDDTEDCFPSVPFPGVPPDGPSAPWVDLFGRCPPSLPSPSVQIIALATARPVCCSNRTGSPHWRVHQRAHKIEAESHSCPDVVGQVQRK